MQDLNCSCEFSQRYCPVHGDHRGRDTDAKRSDRQQKLLSILPSLSALNAWMRAPYGQKLDMEPPVYQWKNAVIAAAMREGIAQLRIVAVERPCRTCKGTGTYIWVNWHDEDDRRYEPCRKCAETGKVTLRFVESKIHRWTFHTPRPRWDLGYFADDAWDKPHPTDWEPEQPGRPMERLELFAHLNAVESVIYEGRRIEPRYGNASNYTLHLGDMPLCWICNERETHYRWDVYRHCGLRWKAGLCEICDDHVAWKDVTPTWPVNLHRLDERGNTFPEWGDRVPLPPIASDPIVLQWLERRHVYPGRYWPGELAYSSCGDLVRVVEATQASYEVEVIERWGWTGTWEGRPQREHIGWLHEAKLIVQDLYPTGRRSYLPQFDWSEVRA
jgi:hypothetical protein